MGQHRFWGIPFEIAYALGLSALAHNDVCSSFVHDGGCQDDPSSSLD